MVTDVISVVFRCQVFTKTSHPKGIVIRDYLGSGRDRREMLIGCVCVCVSLYDIS